MHLYLWGLAIQDCQLASLVLKAGTDGATWFTCEVVCGFECGKMPGGAHKALSWYSRMTTIFSCGSIEGGSLRF